MRKLFLSTALVVCLFVVPFLVQATTIAPYLYNPIIFFEGKAKYVAADHLEIQATVTAFHQKTIPWGTSGGKVFIHGLWSHSGTWAAGIQGDFKPGKFEVCDGSGKTAIYGEILLIGVNGINNTGVGIGGFYFKPLGGYLLKDFLAVGPVGGSLLHFYNVTPEWSPKSFGQDWTGDVEGKIGATPEPTSLLLLGSGLLGFGVFARLRRRKKE